MITSQQVRIILDRNRNGLDGRPLVKPGERLSVGLYWDPTARKVVAVDSPRPAETACVLLSSDPNISFDELVRLMAMGGGGRSGRAVDYHLGVAHGHARPH